MEDLGKLKQLQIQQFILTFVSYSLYHATRTGFSFSKGEMKIQLGISDNDFGWIDLSFMFFYAFGQLFLGELGDRMHLTNYLLFGLFHSIMALSLLTICGFYNYYNFAIFCFLQGVNGLGQSTGHTVYISIIGNWMGKQKRGLLLGVWLGATNFGDILGFIIGGFVLHTLKLSFQWVLFIVTLNLVITAVINIQRLIPYPEESGYSEAFIKNTIQEQDIELIEYKIANNGVSELPQQLQEVKQLNYITAWKIPMVPLYSLTYGILKSAMYGTLFWLPKFLQENGIVGLSSSISSMFDLGVFLGGTYCGYISDKYYSKRSIFMTPSCFIASFILYYIFSLKNADGLTYLIWVFLFGCFFGGPYNILNGTIAVDISSRPYLKQYGKSIATITALIDGSGSLIAGLLQRIIPAIGQNYIFQIFFTLVFIGSFLLIQNTIKEWRELQLILKTKSQNNVNGIHDTLIQ